MRRPSPAFFLLAPAAAALVLSGCTSQPAADGATGTAPITVTATDTTCELSATSAPSGPATFAITNNGTQMTEFYIYDEAGTKIITEKPNIGPGISATLVYDFAPGTYTTACRPNGTGVGIRAAFTVAAGSGPASAAPVSAELAKSVATYRSYVEAQTAALLPATEEFAAAVKAGDLARAKALYPTARQHYERIEPVAETFVDLDYKIDIREDGIEDGKPWTGWHAIEKLLWVDGTTKGAEQLARGLVADTRSLAAEIPGLELTPSLIGNGASGLMEEVAVGKVTGEEERYSHTDIWDFVANVEGAEAAFQSLEQSATTADADLSRRISAQFSALETELASLERADGSYPLYTELSKAQVKALSDSVNALSEPLSRLTAAVVR